MNEQMTIFPIPKKDNTQAKAKRKWEKAFQKWSDEHGLEADHIEYLPPIVPIDSEVEE